ncbi:polysaccharide biosynthesis/export family protein [Mesorhizobium sp. B1-1-8]|uniref:polysaccharide biosynthesis/export family protein n=1 Tax=Mesorhizobium sp. B1-1-8 TaxID=2589976 RepID=UPI00112CE489|nr:polysaccharide biosynthesis/export family protein [Mesorhizobium sp. B1-1-8]UCI10466.1 polysaccharide biosynthesis/export family protein [Mesorhizobium sp. B1-1-8]
MAIDAKRNSEPVCPQASPSTRSKGQEANARLLVFGLCGLALVGAAAKNWDAAEAVSTAVVQRTEAASTAVAQKAEAVSAAVVEKAEAVSAAIVQKAKPISAAVVQKVTAIVDSWQDQPAQASTEPSPAAAPGANRSATMLVERGIVSTPTAIGPVPGARAAVDSGAERPNTISTAQDAPTGGLFAVGDRLKIAFYERVDVEEDKWGRASSASALRGILQRPELSGEYTVQEDGTISVPLLGSISVANRSARQVQADLLETFGQLLGRKGLVNILSLERSPIYVLGPVKNSGSFKYAPGMTILHAIALAGGLDLGASEPWQKIEAARETQKRSGAIDAMAKLLARSAVLKAERDSTQPKIPAQLLELVGATEAANLVQEQSDRREAAAIARKSRQRAILSELEAAKQDMVGYGHVESLDELVKLRQERVNAMRSLVDRNVLSQTVLDQVQSDLSDAKQRQRDALNQYADAKRRLASLESEALQIQADIRSNLETEIETNENQIAANESELKVSEGVLETLPVTEAKFAKDPNRVTYQIVRQSAAGPVSIASVGMTLLRPGDLVNIIVGGSEPGGQAGARVATSRSGERLPAACTQNGAETDCVVAQRRIGPN